MSWPRDAKCSSDTWSKFKKKKKKSPKEPSFIYTKALYCMSVSTMLPFPPAA